MITYIWLHTYCYQVYDQVYDLLYMIDAYMTIRIWLTCIWSRIWSRIWSTCIWSRIWLYPYMITNIWLHTYYPHTYDHISNPMCVPIYVSHIHIYDSVYDHILADIWGSYMIVHYNHIRNPDGMPFLSMSWTLTV